ncbi:MAG: BlaI/MecI/CopY family transcriptional regulator [Phycisphaeraceae bacterium]|nr:BlaI/MecI/CopY family transcriptional regulator [Phycisphaeraceae bacterium]
MKRPGSQPPAPADLGAAELEALTTLWDDGPATVREVMEGLHRRGRKVAYTTVLTFLTRLEQKGYVASDKSGVAYIYRAKAPRERVVGSRVRSLMQQMFGGAAAPMALHLLRNERFTHDEIEELRRLIDQLAAESDTTDPEDKA